MLLLPKNYTASYKQRSTEHHPDPTYRCRDEIIHSSNSDISRSRSCHDLDHPVAIVAVMTRSRRESYRTDPTPQ